MKKVYLTLVLTLIVSLFYIGFARAGEVRKVQPAKSAVAAQPPKVESKEITRLKDKFKNSDYDLEYTVVEISGDLILKTKNIKCPTCVIEDQKIALEKNNRSLLAIKEAAEKTLTTLVGAKNDKKVKEKDDEAILAKIKEDHKKEKIENCQLDKEGKVWKKANDKIQCALDKIAVLTVYCQDTRVYSEDRCTKEDLAAATQMWDSIIRVNLENDIANGNYSSLAMQAVNEILASNKNDIATQAMKNLAATSKAHGFYKATLDMYNQILTDSQMAKLQIDSGNYVEASILVNKINSNKLKYNSLTTSTNDALTTLYKSTPNSLDFRNEYLASHPKDAGMFKGGANVIASTKVVNSTLNQLMIGLNKISKTNGNQSNTSTSSDDFNLNFNLGNIDNTAVSSAGVRPGTNGLLSNNGDSYSSRVAGQTFRGGSANSFNGAAIPNQLTLPNFNLLQQNSNLNLNNNNINTRGGTGSPRT